MKTNLTLCLLFIVSLIQSQEILLSFTAEDENLNPINLKEIEIENLTTGDKITAFDLVEFNLSAAVLSSDSFSVEKPKYGIQQVFPNPATSETNITFYNASKQVNTITVYDVVGKEVTKLSRTFEQGLQTVKFVPNTAGIFFVQLSQQNRSYQSKIIVTKSISTNARLDFIGKSKKENLQKKTAEPFFNIGDELKFIIFYKGVPQSITDKPIKSKNYIFQLNSTLLADNGVTIKAYDDVEVGTKAIFNGAEYTLVDEFSLWNMIALNEDLTKVVTSRIGSMNSLFENKSSFNQDISSWDVSNVRSMSYMFSIATSFNQDISLWDVSNVTRMDRMFSRARSFNQNVSFWNVSNVVDMSHMFSTATSFNQDISNWDVSNVDEMRYMFSTATSFNQDISSWDVSGVTNMSLMFSRATSFNQDISSWNVSNVKYMAYMFFQAESFNQDISSWDVSKVKAMEYMFKEAISFNKDISSWNVCQVEEYKDFSINTSPTWLETYKPNFGDSTKCSGN